MLLFLRLILRSVEVTGAWDGREAYPQFYRNLSFLRWP